MNKYLIIASCLLLPLSGCSYNAKVVSTSSAASEVRLDKHIEENVSYSLSSDLENLSRVVKPASYVCSAHNFPLEVGPSLKSSIRYVLDEAFQEATYTSGRKPTSDAAYHFAFDLVDFEPRLRFSTGFWEAGIDTDSELVMKVRVIDKNGDEVVRSTVSGEGSEHGSGQCGDGASYLAEAAEESVERTLEEFVYKLINSDYFVEHSVSKDASSPGTSKAKKDHLPGPYRFGSN